MKLTVDSKLNNLRLKSKQSGKLQSQTSVNLYNQYNLSQYFDLIHLNLT